MPGPRPRESAGRRRRRRRGASLSPVSSGDLPNRSLAGRDQGGRTAQEQRRAPDARRLGPCRSAGLGRRMPRRRYAGGRVLVVEGPRLVRLGRSAPRAIGLPVRRRLGMAPAAGSVSSPSPCAGPPPLSAGPSRCAMRLGALWASGFVKLGQDVGHKRFDDVEGVLRSAGGSGGDDDEGARAVAGADSDHSAGQ